MIDALVAEWLTPQPKSCFLLERLAANEQDLDFYVADLLESVKICSIPQRFCRVLCRLLLRRHPDGL